MHCPAAAAAAEQPHGAEQHALICIAHACKVLQYPHLAAKERGGGLVADCEEQARQRQIRDLACRGKTGEGNTGVKQPDLKQTVAQDDAQLLASCRSLISPAGAQQRG